MKLLLLFAYLILNLFFQRGKYFQNNKSKKWHLYNHAVQSDNVGWQTLLREDPTEFHDIPLVWEEETEVPDWLSGTYVRNGPAQLSFSSSKRVLTNWLDGFAKLHSFKETLCPFR